MDCEKIMTDGNSLYKGFLKAIKGSTWKESSQRGYLNVLSIIFDIIKDLSNRTYETKIENTFVIHERGRVRNIDSFNVKDRTIRHVLCDEIFSNLIRNKIIYDNGASVKGRGISFSRNRFEVHLRKYYMNHGNNNGYILFGDFSKYYDNILHDIAKQQLIELVDNNQFIEWLLNVIFKSFEINVDGLLEDEINSMYYGTFNKLEYKNYVNKNSTNTIKKSVSIGDQLSQHIGIYYPHEIDNYIKIVKSQKYYGRYMDDWYIMSDSKEELMDLLNDICKISERIGIHINSKKTHIVKMSDTYKFLQIKYTLTDTGKIIKRINPKRITSMRIKLKKLSKKVQNNKIRYDKVEDMFRGWMGSFYKLMSKEQRHNLINLYESLFNKHIYINNGKMTFKEEEFT